MHAKDARAASLGKGAEQLTRGFRGVFLFLFTTSGIINMLAGNLRGDWRAVLPILSFKTIFHVFSALHRLGLGPAMPEGREWSEVRPA